MMRTSDDVLAESAWRVSQGHREAKAARRALARASIVIALQWAIIVWLIWFRKGC
jgi:hypothetical protein